MNSINATHAKLKKDVAKKAEKYSKYFNSSNQICHIKSLPETLNLKDALGIGRKVFAPEYLTISNFASLTVHFYWEDGLIHVHQSHTNNYATDSRVSIVTLSNSIEIESWLKEIKYFIMQKCGWSSFKYRQFMASTYSFILDNLNKRDEFLSSVGDSLSITDLIHSQNLSPVVASEMTVSKKCKNINFVSAWRFHELNNQGTSFKEELCFMYRATLLPVIRLGIISDHQGLVLKANMFDPMGLVSNKNVVLQSVSDKLKEVIQSDIYDVLEAKKNFDQFELLATA